MGKRLLRGMALVAILTLAGMFLPRGVTYASPDSEITVNAEFSSNCQGGTTWYAGVISSGQWNTDSFRSGIDFDTTDIPDTAIITKVELRIDIVEEGATDMNNDVAKMTSKARTYYDANNYSGLMG